MVTVVDKAPSALVLLGPASPPGRTGRTGRLLRASFGLRAEAPRMARMARAEIRVVHAPTGKMVTVTMIVCARDEFWLVAQVSAALLGDRAG
ncbi:MULTISPECIES: hypothetical protein [Streptomyces]|uniref:Uncharacterized protein n=1 Tax=Streptomyces dengpaensis TaxID=2049881 RepID=A0ABM6SKX1_9ACTN|nr:MULTISPECIES: hypothetical protein [Streptomyces]AVH54709.1 hypothetical protein C4B68_01485 [Streptomyces dengpaensis]PIB04181.1 hypothetical protein B1C81_33975 [Streptomyces sp. HG99]